jgi:PAS domain S-box-containing protein
MTNAEEHSSSPVAAESHAKTNVEPSPSKVNDSIQNITKPDLLRIGILAKRGRRKCLDRWEPTAEYLTEHIPGKRFTIVPLDFDEIDYFVQKEKIDFLLANSAIFVKMDAKYGLSPLATLTNLRLDRPCATFGGVLFCRKDHPTIFSTEDLAGKTLTAVDRTSMGGWIAAWRELHLAEIDVENDLSSVSFAGTHDQVVYDVLSGKTDAGTVRTDTLERMAQEGAIRLEDFRVIPHASGIEDFPFMHSTRLYPEWPFAALPTVGKDLSEKVAIALFDMSPEDPAALAAKCAGWSTPHSYQPVHDCLKELALSPYPAPSPPGLLEVLRHHWFWVMGGLLIVLAALAAMLLFIRLNGTLRAAKAELESVFNASIPMIAIGFDHRVLRANVHLCNMLGKSPQDVLGAKCHELFQNERCNSDNCPLKRLKHQDGQYHLEITKHQEHQEDRTYIVTASQLIGANEECIGVVESFNEITSRKKTEKWLQMVKTAIESTSDAIGICNVEREHIYHNRAFTEKFGYTAEELKGEDPLLLFQDKKVAQSVFQTIVGGKTWSGETTFLTKQGRSIPIHLRADAILDEKGELIGLIGVHTDITERKQAERCLREAKQRAEALNEHLEKQTALAQNMTTQAEQANRAKSEFLANMSHEIRTPMTAILGFADMLLKEESFGNMTLESREFIETIRRNGEYLLGLINDILDLSKIEANRLNIEKEECYPVQVISEVLSLMRIRAASKNLELQVRYEGPIPRTIHCDPKRLRQILINIIGNAIKFTHAGSVHVVVRHLAPTCQRNHQSIHLLQFEISDTGIGMTEKQAEMVFQPFTQVDNSVSRRYEGTGLGLAISKRLVEMLGGEISVESTPGDGTIFSFSVETGPLDEVEWFTNVNEIDASTAAQIQESPLAKIKFQGHVLLAEDGIDNQRLISLLLNKHGVEVTIVENGELAIQAYKEAVANNQHYDLILMDMQMPVMDGYTATRRLRQIGCQYPIIALTAHAMQGAKTKCLKVGCDHYLSKPIDRNAFLELIGRCLNSTIPDLRLRTENPI